MSDRSASRKSDPMPADAGTKARIVALCFFAQNLSIGLAYGSFGPLLRESQIHFDVNGVQMSSAMSAMVLAVGLSSPLIGYLFSRISWTVLTTCAALGAGLSYLALSLTSTFALGLVCYVVIGIALCILGILGPISIMRRIEKERLAYLMGLINLPLALIFTPIGVSGLLPLWGRSGVLCAMGAALAVLALGVLTFTLMEPKARELLTGSVSEKRTSTNTAPSPVSYPPPFWMISFAVALMAGCGTGLMVHIVPFGTAKGMDPGSSNSLLSLYAFAGLVGAPLWGWLGDRLTPVLALLVASLMILATTTFMLASGAHGLSISFFVIGACLVPLVAMHSVAISTICGPAAVERMMGASYVIKMPFMFAFSPVMAFIFAKTSSYDAAVLLVAVSSGLAALIFAFLAKGSVQEKSAELRADATN